MIINPARLQMQNLAIANANQRALTLSNAATPFGCCNFFDRCGDGDLMSLHFAGSLPLLDWLNFQVGEQCVRTVEFITYVRPALSDGTPTVGYIAQPCAEPNGYTFGSAKLTVENFGRYGRVGPTRDMMRPTRYCETDPRWRLDGTPVTDETEWDMRFTTEVIMQDLARDVIVGNSGTAGRMDGLENLVKTGYDSPMLDSIVVDWNANTMAGGSGITWNGSPVASTYDFVDVLRAVVRQIRQRISWSTMLANQQMNLGDMVLLMPSPLADELLDFYTCWSVCPGSENIQVMIQSYEARTFRDSLMGGLYGAGSITLDGLTIPIMAYDWELIKGPTRADVYLLTGGIGSVRMWVAEHLSATRAAAQYGELGYFSTDGGRMLGTFETENECTRVKLWMHPRLWTRAPWAQARFMDVKFSKAGPILSPDPLMSSFYPVTSFGAELAECPA